MSHPQDHGSLLEAPSLQPAPPTTPLPNWARIALALLALFLFISAVKMIGGGLKMIAHDPNGKAGIEWAFTQISDPLTGLFIGLLITSLVQSSSFTTSMTVAFVGQQMLGLEAAIPVVMGANIGTSVTNILVSLAHVRRRLEFRRSLGGAIVHDFFNVLSVLLFLPLEAAFGIISRPVGMISRQLGHTPLFSTDPTKQVGFIKTTFAAVGKGFAWLLTDVLGMADIPAGSATAVVAMVLLFGALWLMVRMLRGLLQDRLSGMLSKTLFRNAPLAFVVGILTTASVQSSSVTTSLVVPLVGAGILKLKQIYPYTLGANIGTTVTALLAALGTGNPSAVACALGHLMFNLLGTAVFWPLQFVPISLAKGFAKMAGKRRMMAAGYIVGVFFVLPIVCILISYMLRTR
jgi:sodium-dependent phosphate cotransporter